MALVRTVDRLRRSAVKVGRKLEKRASRTTADTGEQLRASLTVVGNPATAARSQSAKPGTDGSPLLFDSPAISPGLSRPLGLGWLAARPPSSHRAAVTPGGCFTAHPAAAHALLLLAQEACSCPVLVSMPMTLRPCCVSWRGCVSAVGSRRRGWCTPRSSMRCSGAAWRTPLSGYVTALSQPSTA